MKAKREKKTPDTAASVPLWKQVLAEPIALMIALVLIVRPVLDGITYPSYNLVFLLGIALIFTTWAVGQLMRGIPLREGRSIGLLVLFFAVASIASFNTIQVDASLKSLAVWSGYVMLFTVMTNAIRTRLALGIVMGAFLFTISAEAVFSLIHIEWILPDTRVKVHSMPALRQSFFNTSGELDPELVYRLSVNRAFGTLLFPNALAAFMVLGLPYTLLAIKPAWESWRAASAAAGPIKQTNQVLYRALAAGVITWFVTFLVCYVPIAFFFSTTGAGAEVQGPLETYPVPTILLAGVLPAALGIFVVVMTRTRGLEICARSLFAFLLPLAALAQAASLYLTYSRGALLGIGIAAVCVALLLRRSGKHAAQNAEVRTAARHAAALILVAVAALNLVYRPSFAQETPAPAPAPQTPFPPDAPESVEQPLVFELPQAGQDMRTIAEGYDLTLKDLTNPASLRLRWDYWTTGLRMAGDNWLTGVGMGNFGTAYPSYQHVGAGEVKMTHNDYLQVFCETGLFGFIAFAAFWMYWLYTAGKRVVFEVDRTARLHIAGLYCGVLAFLVHSLVDFNFYNPSLATYAFFAAGAVFAYRLPETAPPVQRSGLVQVLMIPVLCVVMFIAGNVARAYWADRLTQNKSGATAILSAAQWMAQYGNPYTFDPTKAKMVELSRLLPLFSEEDRKTGEIAVNRAEIESFGKIGLVLPGQMFREIAPGQSLNTLEILNHGRVAMANPQVAWNLTRKKLEAWIAAYSRADALYPHDPEMAAIIFQFYELLRDISKPDPEAYRAATLACVDWAGEAVRRSPRQAWFREYTGKALWLQASLETRDARKQRDLYLRGLEEFRMGTVLYPTSPRFWRTYAEALREMAKAYREIGDEATKKKYADLGKNARDTAIRLEAEIEKARLRRLGLATD